MKRNSHLALVGLVVLAPLLITACTMPSKKILLIPREGSINLEMALTKESGVMISMLRDAGYRIVVATDSGKPLSGKAVSLKPELKLSEVRVADYIGIIMPCMNAGTRPSPPEAVRIVKEAASLGLPIAAQRGSVLILNSAGLRDREKQPELSKDAEWYYGGTGVFQDGMIITSGICPYYSWETGKPDGTTELTNRFIAQLKKAQK